VILCSLKHIKISIQAFNTLKWAQKHKQCSTELTTHLTNTQACFDLFCIVCLPRVSAQLLMRIGSTLCSRILHFVIVVYKFIPLSERL